jgi:hypothetical protein
VNTDIVIENENDAWLLLEKVLKEGMPEGPFDLIFKNWPVLEFRLKGEKFDSSLTVKVMQGFVDLQKNLNSAYSQLKYNRPSAVGLSAAEREKLEIVVKVDKGSSLFKVDLQPAAEALLQGVAGKMTGTEIIITVLGVSLIAGGVICAKAYFESQRQIKQIDVVPLLSTQETERLKIFAQAVKKNEKLGIIYEDAEETYDSILRGASEADYLEIGGQKIHKDLIEDLIRQKRSRSVDVQLNGMYRILKVDSSKPEDFLVEVRSQEDGSTFTAKLEDKWVFRRETNLELLKNAEWGKAQVFLRINGKELRGNINQAVILDVGQEE